MKFRGEKLTRRRWEPHHHIRKYRANNGNGVDCVNACKNRECLITACHARRFIIIPVVFFFYYYDVQLYILSDYCDGGANDCREKVNSRS